MFTHTTLIKPKNINQLYEAKALNNIPMCPRERSVLISISTGLSFAKKGLGHLLQLFVVFITWILFLCFIRKPLKIRLLSITEIYCSIPLVNTFYSLLGSTLLFIESTTIH